MREDEIRLRHAVDAAREAISLTVGKTIQDFETERLLQLALIRELEVIGEAISHVSPECREMYASVPWFELISLRHRLIHSYFDLDFDVVWNTVTKELPSLIISLEKILMA